MTVPARLQSARAAVASDPARAPLRPWDGERPAPGSEAFVGAEFWLGAAATVVAWGAVSLTVLRWF
ncbi:MAG TPA: hypothetical protein VFE82_11935 [Ramlibacter sp.]|jgi:hypothetical protein|uniref:hypothetical protein n=1 Tax=Ramlibacter sp. TaxID=1917967 RepID=UPI002D335911|nr:hypothetical protein [Ramlibacter sp.]HZY19183.1 hypothetical protein [Ramlibacter sp.]